MDPEELLQRAKEGDMVAQYDLAEYYGRLLKQTEDETEIYQYSLDAMLWLKRSAQQGYGPAREALNELEMRPGPAGDKRQPGPAPAGSTGVPAVETQPYAAGEATAGNRAPGPAAEEAEPEADDETVAAVTAAVLESAAEMADVGGNPRWAVSPEQYEPSGDDGKPEDKPREGVFASGTNLALFVMLIISLLLNALLLAFLFRMSRQSGSVRAVPTPVPVAEVTPSPAPSPSPTPGPTPSPTAEPTPEPTAEPTPEPTPEPFWLDLSQYPKLELKPNEDLLYEDYVYYIVTADVSLNMRSGPDTRYARITSIPGMAKVGAVSKYGSWYLVEYEGEMGWVHGAYLTDDLNYRRPNSSSGDLNEY